MKNAKKIVTVLLVAVVAVGTYFVAGTYAKYTSTITGTGTAGVAKWSWVVGNDTITTAEQATASHTFHLFDSILDTLNSEAETDVDTSLIAPGTKGEVTLTITNNSEVNATYTIALSATNTSNIPIEYSSDGTTWVTDVSTLGVSSATNIAMKGGSVSPKIYWRWAFTGAASTNYTSSQTDVTDTALGFAANTTRPEVTVTATVVLTQVD